MRIGYSVEESPAGTAGSVKLAEAELDETFLVISGDALCDIDLGALVKQTASAFDGRAARAGVGSTAAATSFTARTVRWRMDTMRLPSIQQRKDTMSSGCAP